MAVATCAFMSRGIAACCCCAVFVEIPCRACTCCASCIMAACNCSILPLLMSAFCCSLLLSALNASSLIPAAAAILALILCELASRSALRCLLDAAFASLACLSSTTSVKASRVLSASCRRTTCRFATHPTDTTRGFPPSVVSSTGSLPGWPSRYCWPSSPAFIAASR